VYYYRSSYNDNTGEYVAIPDGISEDEIVKSEKRDDEEAEDPKRTASTAKPKFFSSGIHASPLVCFRNPLSPHSFLLLLICWQWLMRQRARPRGRALSSLEIADSLLGYGHSFITTHRAHSLIGCCPVAEFDMVASQLQVTAITNNLSIYLSIYLSFFSFFLVFFWFVLLFCSFGLWLLL